MQAAIAFYLQISNNNINNILMKPYKFATSYIINCQTMFSLQGCHKFVRYSTRFSQASLSLVLYEVVTS